MRADYRVLLDACVLIPMPMADSLLRMAEEPRLYVPKWPQLIMDEVTRNLIEKWGLEPRKRVAANAKSSVIFRKHGSKVSSHSWGL
jgi:hypothetical protein